MVKRFIWMASLLTLVFGGAIGFKLYKRAAIRDYIENMGVPAVHLNAAVVTAATWQQQLAGIGTLRAQRGVDLRSEVNAVVRSVHVDPGTAVDAGDLLVELDDTVDRATLKSARVRLDKAQRDFERDKTLFERKLISADEFENSRSEYQSAQALVEETQGIIGKKTIRAPFAGTVGIHNLVEGQYLGQGDYMLSLQSLDALYLDLQFPEKNLEHLNAGQRVVFTVPSHGDRLFSAEVRFVDIQVKATTRNVQVRAVVDNPGQELLPGMFANATVILNEARPVLTLPREAVAYSLYGETIYLLQQNGAGGQDQTVWVAHRQIVRTGEVREGRVAVEGLAPGQLVALDTQNRLLERTPVVIANAVELGLPDTDAEAP